MVTMGELWTHTGSALATLMFIYAMVDRVFPPQLRGYLQRYFQKFVSLIYPYVQITFHEFTGENWKRSEAYLIIKSYLSENSTSRAKRLKAEAGKGKRPLLLSMDDHEEVTDEFNGVQIWWQSNKQTPRNNSISFYPASEEHRFYKLTFHKRHRKLITEDYLDHVLKEGKNIAVKNRQRNLYTNNPSHNWSGWKQTKWSHVPFEHPATFETLGMEKKKKEEIKSDLIKFTKGKDYYLKIGKPWKRGYLLYGPPGTGKSTMIAAMANFLEYDVYDLELTAVKDNTELRRLLIETSSKSIIVIEDIDCSLDLTGQRKKKLVEEEETPDSVKKAEKMARKNAENSEQSKVSLSGLLNFIDGLWSACGGERIIIFTTNFLDKLDPALIRRGRMDKHIEMSYCCFEAFEVLAKNYLDVESHELFGEIKKLLKEANLSPADVAENLMPKSDGEDEEICLKRLVEALEAAKEEAKKTGEEEAAKKAEAEERKKKESEEKEKGEEKDCEKSDKEVKENGFVSEEKEIEE